MTKKTEGKTDEVPQDPEGTPKPGLERSLEVAGAEQVQAAVDKEHEQGFCGVKADPTDDVAYTIKGVTEGYPTPETDEDHAEWVRQEQRKAQKGTI